MGKTVLVLINGHAGVGKDTFVRYCKEYAESENICKVYNIHRSDAPKMALKSIGWTGDKDEETRDLLKHMVDYMELKDLLNPYLDDQLKYCRLVCYNSILFYHVRDPEVMYRLIDKYIESNDVRPISLLLKRDIERKQEPNDWWGDLENADYMMTLNLETNNFSKMSEAAAAFVEFLQLYDWKIVKQEGAEYEHE